MNDPGDRFTPSQTDAADEQGVERQQAPSAACPPFDATRARRRMELESWLRFAMFMGFVLVFVGASFLEDVFGAASAMLVVVVLGAWIIIGISGARVSQQLQRITTLIDVDPAVAEDELARAMRRWPLPRGVRLLLLHRLAAIRHRQRQFTEAQMICQFLLSHETFALRPVRAHVLLMLAEAQMQTGPVACAWPALAQLSAMRLRLAESLQYHALQGQYEVSSGYIDHALHDLPSKLSMLELLPAEQCGMLHLLYAEAARQSQQPTLEQWLRDRAALLCSDDAAQAAARQPVVSTVADMSDLGGDDPLR